MDLLETQQGIVFLFYTSEEYETTVWRNENTTYDYVYMKKLNLTEHNNTEHSLVVWLAHHDSLSLTRRLT
jgi:hypothetical protein